MLSDGMRRMLKKAGSLQKNTLDLDFNRLKSAFIVLLIIFTLFFSLISFFGCNNNIAIAEYSGYIPSPPIGNSTGDLNIDHTYIIYTSDAGSHWMFDWGDGNFSEWIEVKVSDTSISQSYSWNSYGIYEVRVRHRSSYIGESTWSDPLIVTIAIPPDLDGDGYNNDLEAAYGKNPDDPDDYPLDTDGDGTPDDDSADGSFTGDLDDDNDGLSDTIEESLGSNSLDDSDVTTLVIEQTIYYLVDTDDDGNGNILYNTQTETQTNTNIEDGKICLDTSGDGLWDYTFQNGIVESYKAPFPWLYVIIGVILTVAIILLLLFKMGVFYLYEEEYVVEE